MVSFILMNITIKTMVRLHKYQVQINYWFHEDDGRDSAVGTDSADVEF